jgi:GntR family transcriptional regulator/MocR family aminotransferase
MRRSRGSLLPPIPARRVRRPDLYRALRNAVLDGTLGPAEQLPSSRNAGSDYGVSRGMVEEVYGQLTDEGFLERAVGRGTFVARGAARLAAPAARAATRYRRASPSRRGREVAGNAACREPEALRPFNAGTADTREFPWPAWQRLQARAARELGPRGLAFADPRGLAALRAATARYLAQIRGIACAPGQVVIFSSSQQALHALVLLLLDRGDAVWLEDPCYLGARAALELAGVAIAPVPVDAQGLSVEAGIRRAPRARLVYVTPSHQYPTGVALSLERRIALLEWAGRRGAWIVEDDYDGELRYAGQPLTPLHSLDNSGRVLYLGTFSKAMFVSLRLAYAVVPEELVEPLANIRTQLDGFTPPLPQATMALFMEEGRFSAHLRRMRTVYGAKRAVLVERLGPLAAHGFSWSDNPAGMHLLLRHDDAAPVRALAASSRLDLALLSAYRMRPALDEGLLLRFGGLDPAAIDQGARALVAAARRPRPRRG